MTNNSTVIRNAWPFWCAVSFVFKAQCGSFCLASLTR
ncbi:DUF3265 domain-containing protein [Vibrio parahaemolyticus]